MRPTSKKLASRAAKREFKPPLSRDLRDFGGRGPPYPFGEPTLAPAAFQRAFILRSVCLRGSGPVAPSAPASSLQNAPVSSADLVWTARMIRPCLAKSTQRLRWWCDLGRVLGLVSSVVPTAMARSDPSRMADPSDGSHSKVQEGHEQRLGASRVGAASIFAQALLGR